jgi:3-oxoadipate CoA-transferase beta subunit
VGCVKRVYTDLATLAIGPGGVTAVDWVDGLPFDELVRISGVPLLKP